MNYLIYLLIGWNVILTYRHLRMVNYTTSIRNVLYELIESYNDTVKTTKQSKQKLANIDKDLVAFKNFMNLIKKGKNNVGINNK